MVRRRFARRSGTNRLRKVSSCSLCLATLFWEGCIRCNQYPCRRIIEDYGEELEHLIPNQLAGLVRGAATTHRSILKGISSKPERCRPRRCSLHRGPEPDAALRRSARLELHDNWVVHGISRTAVDHEGVLHSNRSGQYKLSPDKSPLTSKFDG